MQFFLSHRKITLNGNIHFDLADHADTVSGIDKDTNSHIEAKLNE